MAVILWKYFEILKPQVICKQIQIRGPLIVMEVIIQGAGDYWLVIWEGGFRNIKAADKKPFPRRPNSSNFLATCWVSEVLFFFFRFSFGGFTGGGGGLFAFASKHRVSSTAPCWLGFSQESGLCLASNQSVNHQPRHTSIRTVFVLCQQEKRMHVHLFSFHFLLPSIIYYWRK